MNRNEVDLFNTSVITYVGCSSTHAVIEFGMDTVLLYCSCHEFQTSSFSSWTISNHSFWTQSLHSSQSNLNHVSETNCSYTLKESLLLETSCVIVVALLIPVSFDKIRQLALALIGCWGIVGRCTCTR